jgi:gamma-glutamyl hercynylcysteine S-oxide hydrolase
MCRVAAYLGPPAPLSLLLYDTPRSLEVQAYDPREQHSGHVNVDGTGVVWWADEPEPLRYVTDRSPWADANLPALAPRLRSGVQLAAVRSATPGIPAGPANVAPFTHGRVAAVHNGSIGGFLERTRRPLMQRLPDHLLACYGGSSDSELLLLHIVHAAEERPGAGLAAAVCSAAETVLQVASGCGVTASLTVLVADGERVIALRQASAGTPCNTLYALPDPPGHPGAALLASEPLTADPGWRLLPERTACEFPVADAMEAAPR